MLSRINSSWEPGILVYVAIVFAFGGAGTGCAKQQAAPPKRPAVPVVVSRVVQKTEPIEVDAIGNVEAYSTVEIKAQASGYLLDAHFKEGDFVRKGQLLLTIDPRPYQAALLQAQAALARDKAAAANNRVQAERTKKLLDAGIVPVQDAESAVSTADASDAVVNADQAAIQTAQLNLDFCQISSPIDGRTGVLMLKPGNLLKVADVPILVITQVSPIFVNFTVPQQYLPAIRKYMSQGTLSVEARVPDDPGPPEKGALTFVDNLVDVTTGTIHLRGTFENPDNRLWPGQYASILLTLSQEPNSTVLPSQAVVTSQQGTYVYVVAPGNTVQQRTVVVKRTVGNDTVIDKGVQPGEIVVIDGQVNLVPGTKVQIKNSDVTMAGDQATTEQSGHATDGQHASQAQ